MEDLVELTEMDLVELICPGHGAGCKVFEAMLLEEDLIGTAGVVDATAERGVANL